MTETHLDALCTELRALGRSQGFTRAQLERDLGALTALCAPCAWAHRPRREPPPPSYFAHRVPYGTSVVFGAGAPEVRALVEAQHEPSSPAAYFRAGRELTARFASLPGAATGPFEALTPAFEPTEPRPPFAMWHGLVLTQGVRPWGKGYLSALARGRGEATLDATRAALASSGFGRSLDALRPLVRAGRDDVTIVSLDFTHETSSRVKLYLLQRGVTLDALERSCALAPTHRPGDALRFAECFFDDAEQERWWLTCFTFDAQHRAAPASVTVHLGAARAVRDDARVEAGVRALLALHAMDPAPYDLALSALRTTGLPAPYRRHHFVSWQRVCGAPRVTVYFHPPDARPASAA